MKCLSKSIRNYFENTNHWVSYAILDTALGIETREQRTARRVAIKRLVDKGFLTAHPQLNGVYIKLQKVF